MQRTEIWSWEHW